MAYKLQIDLDPEDNIMYDVDLDLNATNNADAITEAKNILTSGKYKSPTASGEEAVSLDKYSEIIGYLRDGMISIADITVGFMCRKMQEPRIKTY